MPKITDITTITTLTNTSTVVVTDQGLVRRISYQNLHNQLVGYTGSRGVIGSTGTVGYTGSRSTATGYTGSASTATGYTGSTGTQGNVGYTGSRSTATGYTGSTGTQGNVGYTGSASTATGYTGSTGTQGNVGYTGSASTATTGYTGSTGTQGNVGYTGSRSTATGYTGSTGTQGNVGYTGSTGTQGNVGFTGSTGTQGNVGYTGSASNAAASTTTTTYTAVLNNYVGSTRTAAAKFSDAYSVKDFGAVGDGITDDTIAIQTLIDALSTSTNGGTVFFPAGAYKITNNLTITWPNATVNQDIPSGRVTLKGEGSSISFIYDYRNDNITTATNSGAIVIDTSAGAGARFFTMDMGGFSIIKKINATTIGGNPLTYTVGTGVGILMNAVAGTGWFHDIRLVGHYNAIKLKDCLGLAFSNVKISTANIGIFAYGTTFSEPTDMEFKNCSISGCKAFAYMFLGGGPIVVDGGLLESNGVPSGSDQGVSGGIYHRQSSFLPNQLNVDGVYFENQRGDADIYIDVPNGTAARAVNNITNCMFARPDNSAIGIVGTATNMIYVTNANSAGVAKLIVNVTGNGFKNFSPYVADSGRMYVAKNGPDITMNASTSTNFYDDPTETPSF